MSVKGDIGTRGYNNDRVISERGDIMTSVSVSVGVGVGDTMRRINRKGG